MWVFGKSSPGREKKRGPEAGESSTIQKQVPGSLGLGGIYYWLDLIKGTSPLRLKIAYLLGLKVEDPPNLTPLPIPPCSSPSSFSLSPRLIHGAILTKTSPSF